VANEGSDPKHTGVGRLSSSQPEHLLEALGRAIKVVRTAHGLGRRDLSELAGLSYSYLTEIENGTKQPSPRALRTLGKALGVNASELMHMAESWHGTGEDAGEFLLEQVTAMTGVLTEGIPETSPVAGLQPMSEQWPKRPRRWLRRGRETDAPPDSATPEQDELVQRYNQLSPEDRERVLDLVRRLGGDES
jgi:transcriptional regulator with XRE-family HTH domain